MKLTFAITCCDEYDYLKRLLTQLTTGPKYIQETCEILVQYDTNRATKEVVDLLYEFKNDENHNVKINITSFPLDTGDGPNFARFKNHLSQYAKGEWIFQIDADEYLTSILLEKLPDLLNTLDEEIDVVRISRINVVTGITEEHIARWRWNKSTIEGKEVINWPDPQWRLYRNNESIKWTRPVHEYLEGFRFSTELISPHFSLIHEKDIKRQEDQNNFYSENF